MSNGLRITILGLNYSPEHSGVAKYTSGLAEGLSLLGNDLTVITSLPHYPSWKIRVEDKSLLGNFIEKNVHVKRVRHFVPKRPTFIFRLISEISFGLSSSMTKWNSPNVLIVVSPGLFSSAISLLRAKISPKKYKIVFWVQDLYGLGLSQLTGKSFIAGSLSYVEKKILKASDVIVVPHESFVHSLVKQQIKKPIEVIRNWSHLDAKKNIARKAPKFYKTPGSHNFIVLHTGNMGKKQGLENVVAAAKLAEIKGLPLHFVLAGEGTEREYLKKLAYNVTTISIIPSVANEDYESLLSSADVLLLNELPGVSTMSIPSKLTSYFFSGKPVIAATDLTGTSAQEIQSAGAGLIVKAGEPSLLLVAIEELRKSPDLARSLGEAGKAYANTTLTSQAALIAWLKVLHKS